MMGENKNEKGFSGEKDILAKTKMEITELRNKALQANLEPNLIDSNPDVLTEEDARMWQKINSLKTIEEYNELTNIFSVKKNEMFSRQIEKNSDLFFRQEFWAFMSNKLIGKSEKIFEIHFVQEIIKGLQKIASENKDSEEAKNPSLKFIDPLLISEQEAELMYDMQTIKSMKDYDKFKEEYDAVPFPEDTNKHSFHFMQFVANRATGKLAEILKNEKES
jgi:hypothetical protein